LLKLVDIRVSYGRDCILNGIDLEVNSGESLAIIGESGAGKTTLGLSLMRLVEGDIRGQVYLDGQDLLSLPEATMRDIRGRRISMAFQNANNALNPVHDVLGQVMEPLLAHGISDKAEARERASGSLTRCGLNPDKFSSYPHQLSGGEQQRVLIAMALVSEPELVILDEPVSSLDAASRAEIIELLQGVRGNSTLIIVTHDIASAAHLADRVASLYAGRIMELGATTDVLSGPRHPYTRALLRSYPNMTTVKDLQGIKGRLLRPVSGCPFHPRCTQAIPVCAQEVPELTDHEGRSLACHRGGVVTLLQTRDLSKSFGRIKAVDSVSIDIAGGETLALVGQSGSGKTTLAKTIVGLTQADSGDVYLEGEKIDSRNREFYRQVQMISQNPGEALSHRLTVQELVMEPLNIQDIGSNEERRLKVARVLEEVELPASEAFLDTYPHHLSGGEMQRVAIARALVLDPKLLIADEPTAFLDSSVQAKILRLLLTLQEQRGLSMLFITHDIAMARKVSDRIAVMLDGRIVEQGPANRVVTEPRHPYTVQLISTASHLHLWGDGDRLHHTHYQ
jgi:peptide/nickel transport system ATP-binding protein